MKKQILILTFALFTVVGYGQIERLSYDSATIIMQDTSIEIAVESDIVFDPTGFTLYSSNQVHTYLVTGSEFDPLPIRRFYDTGRTVPPDSTEKADNIITIIYGVFGYARVQVIAVTSKSIRKSLPILKKGNTGVIFH